MWVELTRRNSHFHQVLDGIIQLYPHYVKPVTDEVPKAILDNPKRWPEFKGCVGALDGSHFPIHVPLEQQKPYRNRYGYLSQNVLAVVDFDMNFTYILAGWEGSAHDGRVLKDALGKDLTVPEGCYYLADAGYSNSSFTLTPFRSVRYHLREIQQAEQKPKDMYELFNFRHSSLRNVVERTFGVFKRRWRIFDRPHEFDLSTQRRLVYALAAVHNLINLHYPVGEDFDFVATLPAVEEPERRQANRINLNGRDRMDKKRIEIATSLWERTRP